MRFLHTGDWHVGKALQGRNRSDEHEAVLDEIVTIARERDVDATLVAGDLFDSTAPSPEAERIVYKALLGLAQVGEVVVVPGNHDNERRLDAVKNLLDLGNVTVVPFISKEPYVEITGKDGSTASVATVPWISQRYVVRAEQLMGLDAFELSGVFAERLRRIVELLDKGFRKDTVNVILGHLTVTGALLGGGERTAQTIFDYQIDASVFPASAHYVALGHIHKRQMLPARCPMHYCGAPMHLDFSDDPSDRCVLVVNATPGEPATVDEVALTAGRRLRTVKGTLSDLQTLGDQGDDYLRVIVREKSSVGLGDTVRELFPNAVQVKIESPEQSAEPKRDSNENLSPPELFTHYLAGRDIEDPALVSLFTEIYEDAI